MTQEERKAKAKEDILKGIELRNQAIDILEQAEKAFKSAGIELCGHLDKKEIHIYSGIKKMEKALDVKAAHPVDWSGKEDHTRVEVVIDDVHCFEIGTPSDRKYIYK